MPLTPNHGLRFPTLGQPPNGPLQITNLAEDAERELNEHDVDIASINDDLTALTQRVADLETGKTLVGWVPIGNGFESGASFELDLTDGGKFPVGHFGMLRLNARFDLNALTGTIRCRINSDTGTGTNYRTSVVSIDGLGNVETPLAALTDNWILCDAGSVATNAFTAIIYDTGNANLHSLTSVGSRQSDDSSARKVTLAVGSLASALSAAPQTLEILPGNDATSIISFFYWLEGWKAAP